MPLDYNKIKQWPFKRQTRDYTRAELTSIAAGFGAGLQDSMQAMDESFLGDAAEPLPMAAVALADGEFWQADPAAGLHWQQIVHAQEGITVHRPLPPEGRVSVDRRIVEIYDRGADKGAMVLEQQWMRDAQGTLLVTIDVITVLRADGGFGGSAEGAPKPQPVPADRPCDAQLELASPTRDEPVFALSSDFDVTSAVRGAAPGQRMLRGLCAFGVAGRAVLQLVCGNQPTRLRKLVVRYAGPMLTDETLRVELWHTATGEAAFRMRAVERDEPVLHHCYAQFAV